MEWPIPEQDFLEAVPGKATFRAREAEIVYAADCIWPVGKDEINLWQYFDCNMSLERAFGWPPQKKQKLKNPWKVSEVPCQTGSAVMAARKVHLDGTKTLRRVHGLEALRLLGWDIPLWGRHNSMEIPHLSNDVLCSMAGNGWSAWHFMPLLVE